MSQGPGRVLIRAGAVVDAAGCRLAPGAVLVDDRRIEAVGPPAALGRTAGARVVDLPRSVLIPALVNAHAHLDLSHLGPVAWSGDFIEWIEMVRHGRAAGESAIAASVRHGADLAAAGGTAFIGDIAGAGSLAPVRALRDSRLRGTSFVEVFGLGRGQDAAIRRLQEIVARVPADAAGVRLGIQPHAPYSCGLAVYRAAGRLGHPLATHLAETLSELEFVADGQGPLAGMLRRLGAWDDSIRGSGLHPIDHVAPVLQECRVLLAHVNYLQARHLAVLGELSATVAYCPRASAYFGHPAPGHAPHRYLDMMAAGIEVALGTDSLLCLDTPERISVLDEMRFLHRRDGTDPRVLLRMATVAGARCLGVDPALVTLGPGPTAGILAVDVEPGALHDPHGAVVRSRGAPGWVIQPPEKEQAT